MTNSWGEPAWPDPYAARPDDRFRPQLEIDGPHPQRRLTVAFRLVLLVPHFIVLVVLNLVGFVIAVVGWFSALVLGRLPGSVARFLAGLLGLNIRVMAYAMLMTDQYPWFDLSPDVGAARIEVRPGRLNRWAVLFRLLVNLPASVFAGILSIGWEVLAFFFWLVVLVVGRMPVPVFDATAAVVRLQLRQYAYLLMLTDAYPVVGTMGDGAIRPLPQGAPHCRTRPLVLRGGGKALVVVFIVLGVVGYLTSNLLPTHDINLGGDGSGVTVSVP